MPSFLGLPLISNVFVARSRRKNTSGERSSSASHFTAEQRFRRAAAAGGVRYNFERQQTKDVNF